MNIEAHKPDSLLLEFHYYASDQINSTRILTDSTGNVVYSAAHEPYGGIQKTRVTTFDPELKFSGKPFDVESGLSYFGSRYYDPSQFRLLSADSVFTSRAALSSPHRWNLYSYCQGNPCSQIEIDGCLVFSIVPGDTKRVVENQWLGDFGIERPENKYMFGRGLSFLLISVNSVEGKRELAVEVNVNFFLLKDAPVDTFWHEARHVALVCNKLERYAEKIDAAYQRGKLSLEQAKKKIEKAYNRLTLASQIINDFPFIAGLPSITDLYWQQLGESWINWQGDEYMTWLLRVGELMFEPENNI